MEIRSETELRLSNLGHIWIFDLDGTLVKHNGYKMDGKDILFDGVKEFWKRIPDKDMIIILTSRMKEYQLITEQFLRENEIRYDRIIFNAPYGKRIFINDEKPSGLKTAYAINMIRDIWGRLRTMEEN